MNKKLAVHDVILKVGMAYLITLPVFSSPAHQALEHDIDDGVPARAAAFVPQRFPQIRCNHRAREMGIQ
ncbi:MAG: hypothetical protein ONB44_17585 [candidate division KSB1 bacterium]|nr:hypothetical protein [candidate division KSB1 bacterium]MDZ7303939.1 hypothetical protein [candidate division KSB1 bacterium]MDZ7313100.1 hypothetical protein [candidate division KSB1 bacterium]